MSMKEKMARAMYEAMRERIPSGIGPLHVWEQQSEQLHDDWLYAVDAGLDVLMGPTEGVEDAGLKEICGGIVCCDEDGVFERFESDVAESRASDDGVPSDIVLTFQAMVQAVKEGK